MFCALVLWPVWGGLYDCMFTCVFTCVFTRVLCFSVCGHVLCAGPVAGLPHPALHAARGVRLAGRPAVAPHRGQRPRRHHLLRVPLALVRRNTFNIYSTACSHV